MKDLLGIGVAVSLFALMPIAINAQPPGLQVIGDPCDFAPEQCAGLSTQIEQPSDPDVFQFPGRADDLPANTYWFHPGPHTPGRQGLGSDLNAVVETETGYHIVYPAADGTRNSQYVVYEMPVYAMSDGTVVKCWRNAPPNPGPGQYHEKLDKPNDFRDALMPRGGNELWVRLSDGSSMLYAHFQTGSIPAHVCPNSKELFDAPLEDISMPAGNEPVIKKGDFLGLVGNTGNSGAPHLHVHHQRNNLAAPMLMYGGWIKPAEAPGDWAMLTGEQLPDQKTLVFPMH